MRAFYSAREDDEILFAAVNHLNRGSAHLESDLERIELIQLNQKSSEKAKAKSALFSAADFSKKAIELLNVEHDWTNYYDMLLNVYSEAGKLNYACGRFDFSLRCCAQVHRHGRSLTDKLRASHIRIEILHSQRKFKEASQSCLTVLSQLGEVVNPRPNKGNLLIELRRTKRLLKGLSDDALLSLPQMVDPLKVDGMRFLVLLATMSFHATDDLMLSITILRMMQTSIQNGFCEYTPFAFAGYGMLTTVIGSPKEAFNYGCHAITLCGLSETDVCIPGAYLAVFSFLDHLRNPLLNGIEPLLKGYQVGLGNGEVQFAAPCMAASAALGFLCALPLKAYGDDLKNVCEQLKIMKQDMVWSLVAPYWQSTLNLIGEVREGEKVSYGQVFDEKKFLNSTGAPESEKGLPWHNYFMVYYIVAYIFNDFQRAHKTRKEMRKRNNGGPKGLHFIVYLEVFFSGLLDFSLYRMKGKWKALRQAKQAIRTMERYVKDGLVNCHGMLLLLQAELGSFGRHEVVTKKLYDDAMKTFAAGGFIHFHAIASERAAEYMLKVGKRCLFDTYIRASARIYSDWGAFAKTQQLVEEYKLPSKLLGETPPMITIRGGDARRFTPIEGLIEEEHISSDLI
jgi:predicted ATPase